MVRNNSLQIFMYEVQRQNHKNLQVQNIKLLGRTLSTQGHQGGLRFKKLYKRKSYLNCD